MGATHVTVLIRNPAHPIPSFPARTWKPSASAPKANGPTNSRTAARSR